MKRRVFLGQAGTIAASLTIMNRAAMATGPLSGRKVLVCLYMFGGNDAWNLVGPTGSAGQTGLHLFRPNAGAALNLYRSGYWQPGTNYNDAGMGLDVAVQPGLQSLTTAGKLAILGGVGPMASRPLPDQGSPASVPPRIGSHEDQTEQWQAAMKQPFEWTAPRSGVAGRIIKHLISLPPGNDLVRDFGCVSLFGGNTFQNCAGSTGDVVLPYSMAATGGLPGSLIKSAGMTAGNSSWIDGSVMTGAPQGLTIHGAVQENMSAGRANRHASLFAQRFVRAQSLSDEVNPSIPAAAGDPAATTLLKKQLFQVAEMIKTPPARGQLVLNRQTFFVGLGGFDTHAGDNAVLMTQVADAIGAFFARLATLGVSDTEVTLFTASEFGRSLLPNGFGTDHAWGGHHLVAGGAVRPGFYGVFPKNILAHIGQHGKPAIGDAISDGLWVRAGTGMQSSAGHRAIYLPIATSGWLQPHVSTDEYYAELAAWFLDCPELAGSNPSTEIRALRNAILPNYDGLDIADNPMRKLGFLI